MKGLKVYSGTIWEEKAAYCRAIKVGAMIAVSATASIDNNGMIVGRSVYEQAIFILRKIQSVLIELGADKNDVIRTRIFISDITKYDEIADAHREFFRKIDPAMSCFEVSKFADSNILVEIEIDAMQV